MSEQSAPDRPMEEGLASKFSKRLDEARRQAGSGSACRQDASLEIHQPVYSDHMDVSQANKDTDITKSSNHTKAVGHVGLRSNESHRLEVSTSDYSPNTITLAFPPLPMSFERYQDVPQTNSSIQSNQSQDMAYGDGLVGMNNVNNQILFDANFNGIFDGQYQQMLRVSTFTDGTETHGG